MVKQPGQRTFVRAHDNRARRGGILSRRKSVPLAVAWALLITTAFLKLVAAAGSAPVLRNFDEVTGLNLRHLMILSAIVEVLVCCTLIILRSDYWRGVCLVGLGGQFGLYHIAWILMGCHQPCPCLGRVWDWVPWLHAVESHETKAAAAIAVVITLCGTILMHPHANRAQT